MKPTEMLNYLLKVSVCLGVFYLVYRLFLQNDTFFNRNRYYLLATSLLSCILPAINFTSYPEVLLPETYQNQLQLLPQGVQQVQQQFETHITVADYLVYAYLLGVIIFSTVFLYRLLYLIRLTSQSSKIKRQTYTLIYTKKQFPTFSFLHYLFWDDSQPLSKQEEEQIFQHELPNRISTYYPAIYI